jgi:uncharacterized protein DUF3142
MSAIRPCHTLSPNTKQRRLGPWPRLMVVVALALAGLSQWPSSAWLTRPGLEGHGRLAAFPPVVLWAWERPELLDFVDPQAVGVAFLARTLYLSGSEVIVRPRLQPLSVPPETKLMAVVRLEVDRRRLPELSRQQLATATQAVADVSSLHGVQALQVDFDASLSQRAFYRAVLQQLRRQLPASMPLSMTALASWCIYDDWLTGLPVDEAVPMVFRMGVDQPRIRRYLAHGDFRVAACRHSLGLSTDEPPPPVRAARRLYLFHPHAWRPEAMASMFEEVGRWPASP